MKLTIELVPKTAWYSNVRSLVSKEQWDVIRKRCYLQANYKCEICFGKGPAHPVECHEIWEYDDVNHIQTLTGLIALCPKCHQVKHAGLASINNKTDEVIRQLMIVNSMTKQEAMDYHANAFELWHNRSKNEWKCNTDYLTTYMK